MALSPSDSSNPLQALLAQQVETGGGCICWNHFVAQEDHQGLVAAEAVRRSVRPFPLLLSRPMRAQLIVTRSSAEYFSTSPTLERTLVLSFGRRRFFRVSHRFSLRLCRPLLLEL